MVFIFIFVLMIETLFIKTISGEIHFGLLYY
jgi:hypothetical protein